MSERTRIAPSDDAYRPSMTTITAVNVADVEAIEVSPGIARVPLIDTENARGWLIDFAPGTQWPEVDVHVGEERYFVLSGEFIEGDRKYGPGSYVVLADGSSHQPRTVTGGRMLGINLTRR